MEAKHHKMKANFAAVRVQLVDAKIFRSPLECLRNLADLVFTCEMDFLELPTLGKLLDSKETSISYLLRAFDGKSKVKDHLEWDESVDIQQHKCTCLTWQMSGLPCPHVCVVIRTLRHDVYDYIDPCFKVSTQHLIYSGQFQPLPTHNMPKVCEARTLQNGQGNVFPSLQPPQVRRPPGRPGKGVLSHNLAIRELFIALDAMA
ncbi:hypothetical protein CK203_085009 [Vitis vinifera]|uniref:SWIM-type domain-containing protein n=1 Tax=Vitis vinifera TaxID=29760 RepID=A0A438F080_VITVI|nr:hypothetical protein CK203_085009 [Vitis vinifera]